MSSHILGINRATLAFQGSFLLLVWSWHREVRSTACQGFAWVKQRSGMECEAVRILMLASEAKDDVTLGALTWQDMLDGNKGKGGSQEEG